MRQRDSSDRICCDGGCVGDGTCPAFAPGVIKGPYSARQRRARWWGVLSYPLGLLVALVAYLLGPTP